MSWVYENNRKLGPDQLIMAMADGFLTIDSRYIPTAIILGLFKQDGWVIYNNTCHKDENAPEFKYRTTYKRASLK